METGDLETGSAQREVRTPRPLQCKVINAKCKVQSHLCGYPDSAVCGLEDKKMIDRKMPDQIFLSVIFLSVIFLSELLRCYGLLSRFQVANSCSILNSIMLYSSGQAFSDSLMIRFKTSLGMRSGFSLMMRPILIKDSV